MSRLWLLKSQRQMGIPIDEPMNLAAKHQTDGSVSLASVTLLLRLGGYMVKYSYKGSPSHSISHICVLMRLQPERKLQGYWLTPTAPEQVRAKH